MILLLILCEIACLRDNTRNLHTPARKGRQEWVGLGLGGLGGVPEV